MVAAAAVCTLITAAGAGLAVHHWRVVPQWDQWEVVAFYGEWLERGLTLADLTAQHNEHRHALAGLLFLLDYAWFRGTSVLANPALLACQLGLGALLGLLAASGEDRPRRVLAAALAMALMASPANIDNLIMPFHVSIPLVCLLGLLAFFWTAEAVAVRPRGASRLVLAGVALALCPYAMANGLLAAAMTAALAWLHGWQAGAAMSAAAAAAIGLYLWDWEWPADHESMQAEVDSLGGLRSFAVHVLAFLGSPGLGFGKHPGDVLAAIMGPAAAVLWLGVLVLLIRSRRRHRMIDPATLALAMSASFMMATALMIAWGRAGAGAAQAMSTRYATFSLVLWISLLGAAWRLAPELGALSRPARRAVAMAAILLVVLGYAAWYRLGTTTRARTAAVDVATAELRAGRFDPARLKALYPHPEEIRGKVDFLRQNRLSIFAD
jgi:hypothetical protein